MGHQYIKLKKGPSESGPILWWSITNNIKQYIGIYKYHIGHTPKIAESIEWERSHRPLDLNHEHGVQCTCILYYSALSPVFRKYERLSP